MISYCKRLSLYETKIYSIKNNDSQQIKYETVLHLKLEYILNKK